MGVQIAAFWLTLTEAGVSEIAATTIASVALCTLLENTTP